MPPFALAVGWWGWLIQWAGGKWRTTFVRWSTGSVFTLRHKHWSVAVFFGLRNLWKRLESVRVRNCQQTTDKVFEQLVQLKNFLFAPHVVYGELEVHLHVLLTWALEIGEWLYSRSDPIAPGEGAPGRSWVGWLSRRACHTLRRRERNFLTALVSWVNDFRFSTP
jgi:hypothetical protein